MPFKFFKILFNLFKKLFSSNDSTNLKINNLTTASAKCINLDINRRFMKYSLEIFRFKSISPFHHFRDIAVRWQVSTMTHIKRSAISSMKSKNHVCLSLELLRNCFFRSLGRLELFLIFFVFFDIPVLPKILNINNQRTTLAKSMKLNITRKLIEYCLKKNQQRKFFDHPF